ncbi:hypothetical protein D6745_05205 [Candidatus Woesearchaeota archaeon]|nr:MAG: hypothetical protein D6745_05205 [Candidatus Woesearchaeota archaeon]
MKDSDILRAALISGVIGIIILFIILDNARIEEKNIWELNSCNKEETVKIRGVIDEIEYSSSSTIMKVSQKNILVVIAFGNVSAQKGDYVKIIGKINDEGKLVAEEVKVLKPN